MKKTLLLLLTFYTLTFFSQESYYNDIDIYKTGLELKSELASKIISTHTNFLTYTPDVWEASKKTDVNPNNPTEVLLIYGFSASGITTRTSNINNNGGDNGEWNREHTYPRSLGSPNLGTTGAGADAHHLRPSDVQYNSQRSNKKFADGSGNSGDVSGGWYPGDEWKGDIARMMMYMYVRYGDQCLPSVVGVGDKSNTPDDMIDLFLKWNKEDPVSDFERQRNTYHSNTSNTYAQGNRNPFIDNAYLATRIWGGEPAEDYWGVYTSNDNEAPSVPTNVTASNSTLTTIDVSWNASSDNIAVVGYDIYVDGSFNGSTNTTNFTIQNLATNTTFAITVLAKDGVGNMSAQSSATNASTLVDTTAPSVPTNLNANSIKGDRFNLTWSASTDNAAVTGYDIYVNNTYNGTSSSTNYTVNNLTISTTYSVSVLAKDSADNKSAQSSVIEVTTTDGSNPVTELFISEYVEGSGNNKAIEIVNLTDNAVDLSNYSIKKQSNGAGNWVNELPLSGTLEANDVFVVINYQADNATLVSEADMIAPEGSSYGAPINFNGNDPVGLFKNDVFIDIVGELNNTSKDFEEMTLRRKLTVTSPNTSYTASEWEQLPFNTVDGIGVHSNTASIDNSVFESFKMYPNPTVGNTLYFKTSKNLDVEIYNVLGKRIKSEKIDASKNSIDISDILKGIYLVKINSKNQFITKKIIKQ